MKKRKGKVDVAELEKVRSRVETIGILVTCLGLWLYAVERELRALTEAEAE